MEHAEGGHPPPLTVLDQLFHSFVLLTAGATADEREAALTPEELDVLMQTRRVREWLAWLEAEALFEPPAEPPTPLSPRSSASQRPRHLAFRVEKGLAPAALAIIVTSASRM